MRAVVYARYSSHLQRDRSIDDQVRECTEAAEAAGDEVVAVYADRAASGTEAAGRGEFVRMVHDAKGASWERVWVWKCDRFARNRIDAAIYKSALRKSGVDVKYAAEPVPDGPIGVLVESLLEGLAEYYSASLSENSARGLHGNALRCHPNGERRFGYRKSGARFDGEKYVPDDHYEIDPVQADTVREIYRMRAEGMTLREIEGRLAEEGRKNTVGNPISYSVVGRILRDEAYLGVYWYSGVRIDGGIPAIVTREEWDAVRAVDESRGLGVMRDFSGEKIGGWTVICRVGTDKHHKWKWLLRHEDGRETVASARDLASGRFHATHG